MKPAVRIVAAVAVIGLAGFLGWRLLGPDAHRPHRLSGYVEGETLYVGASNSGLVSTMAVQRGDRVKAGQPLFALDAAQLTAARDQAAAQVAIAQAQLRDAEKGQRPQELAVYDAERAAAEAQVRQAQSDYNRIAPLVAKGIYAPARLDQARAAVGARGLIWSRRLWAAARVSWAEATADWAAFTASGRAPSSPTFLRRATAAALARAVSSAALT